MLSLDLIVSKVYNLLRLSELLVGNCHNLKNIFLLTGKESGNQQEMLDELKQSLAKHKVVLTVEYSATLHDREIRLEALCMNSVNATRDANNNVISPIG